uniref:Uncharacterized protein n=1 Tax=Lepeophtheirus salmonis TaxID=72036 RepID=A0A0K2TXQ0_LEPSM
MTDLILPSRDGVDSVTLHTGQRSRDIFSFSMRTSSPTFTMFSKVQHHFFLIESSFKYSFFQQLKSVLRVSVDF